MSLYYAILNRMSVTAADVVCADPSNRERVARKQGLASAFGPPEALPDGRASDALRPLICINHPRNAESIDAHAKSRRPKGLLKRHCHLSVLSQGIEDALAFSLVLQMK